MSNAVGVAKRSSNSFHVRIVSVASGRALWTCMRQKVQITYKSSMHAPTRQMESLLAVSLASHGCLPAWHGAHWSATPAAAAGPSRHGQPTPYGHTAAAAAAWKPAADSAGWHAAGRLHSRLRLRLRHVWSASQHAAAVRTAAWHGSGIPPQQHS